MTWSILAHDPATGALACAVTTCNLAVGAAVPWLRAGVGAVATQSITNRYLGNAVLAAMARGRSAAWTGDRCIEWCGHRPGDGFSIAGNMLAGEAVLADTLAAFITRSELPLPERMLAALHAGEAAGGDRRGRQSAALRLVTTEDWPDIDLRVDDHPEPLVELSRLLGLWRATQAPRLDERPRRADPAGMIDLDVLDARFRAAGLPVKAR